MRSEFSLTLANSIYANRKYAHSSFSSLVQSLLPKDTILRTYLTSLQLVTGTVAAVERLPALHYSVDFTFLSFVIMGLIVEL